MREGRDFIVTERKHPVSGRSRVSLTVSQSGVFQSLAGVFLTGQMVRLPVLHRRRQMSVRRGFMQFGGAWMVFVMGAVIVSSRHIR